MALLKKIWQKVFVHNRANSFKFDVEHEKFRF